MASEDLALGKVLPLYLLTEHQTSELSTKAAYNSRVSWSFYFSTVAFFTLLFGVFLAIAYSVLMGVQENYRRYYQKADLQWTGSVRHPEKKSPPRSRGEGFLLAYRAGTRGYPAYRRLRRTFCARRRRIG